MSSRPNSAFARAFPLRIALWYAGLFVGSVAAVALVTYALLGRALEAQDHSVLESMLTRYAAEYDRLGLPGLRRLIEVDAGEGRHERLLVRVIGAGAAVIYFAEPPGTAAVPAGLAVAGDRTRLRQVLANLIENAVKYTDAGGRIELAGAPRGNAVEVVVRDTGVGIAAADLPFVWDRLYRGDTSRSSRGLGLGLSLVKAIVEAHGGQVAVVSTTGQGTTFTLTLPAATAPPSA